MEYSQFTFQMSNISLAQTSEEGTVWWGEGASGNLIIDESYRSKGTRVKNDKQNIFLDTRHSMLSKIFYFFPRPASYIVKNVCIYANNWLRGDCIWINITFK